MKYKILAQNFPHKNHKKVLVTWKIIKLSPSWGVIGLESGQLD